VLVIGVLRDNSPSELAGITANFLPNSVPLVQSHDGPPVGWLDELMRDGSDLWFHGRVTDPGTARRLRLGPLEVSMETHADSLATLGSAEALDVLRRADAGDSVTIMPKTRRPRQSPWFRGPIGPGWVLTGVACLREDETPRRPGSAMWAR
jgi:hypothetical protein